MMGIGMGMTMAPMTAAVMNAVGPAAGRTRVGNDEHVAGSSAVSSALPCSGRC